MAKANRAIIAEIGDWITARYQEAGTAPDAFAAIAMQAFAKFEVHKQLALGDVLKVGLNPSELPEQFLPGSTFGQPPITLYFQENFVIDAYVWLGSTTAIHEHAFAGAFSILQGRSLHTTYTFETECEVTPRFKTGELIWQQSEILEPGQVRTIERGGNFIHSVFHLTHPTVTICIRTGKHPQSTSEAPQPRRPQFSYFPPGLARDPFGERTVFKRTLDLLWPAQLMDRKLLFQRMAEVLPTLEIHEVSQVLDRLALANSNDLTPVIELTRALEPSLGDVVPFLIRRLTLVAHEKLMNSLREEISNERHRLLLGLLLTVPVQEGLMEIIEKVWTEEDPNDAIVEAVKTMAYADGRSTPLPRAVIAGFGLSTDEEEALHNVLALGMKARESGLGPEAIERFQMNIDKLGALPALRSLCTLSATGPSFEAAI